MKCGEGCAWSDYWNGCQGNYAPAVIAGTPARPDGSLDLPSSDRFQLAPTVSLNVSLGRDYSEEDLEIVTDRQADNLTHMKAAGVLIAVG